MNALTRDSGSHLLETKFQRFLRNHRDDIKWDGNAVVRYTRGYTPVATRRIIESLDGRLGLTKTPTANDEPGLSDQLSTWLVNAPSHQREIADLALAPPSAGVHFVPGKHPIYYDFQNSDIVLDELLKAGARINGRLLDFGCSSGRNLAVLERAYSRDLELHGVDPSSSSIAWVRKHVPDVRVEVSAPQPPLLYPDEMFELVIAKSIWTHFSAEAARAWFAEISRVMTPGGYFFFSTHGPHDIAYRLMYDIPRQNYRIFAGNPKWTRDSFLASIIDGLENDGHFFQSYKREISGGDKEANDSSTTDDWGVMFMLHDYVTSLLPRSLKIVRRDIGRTGNRHDAYVVRKT